MTKSKSENTESYEAKDAIKDFKEYVKGQVEIKDINLEGSKDTALLLNDKFIALIYSQRSIQGKKRYKKEYEYAKENNKRVLVLAVDNREVQYIDGENKKNLLKDYIVHIQSNKDIKKVVDTISTTSRVNIPVHFRRNKGEAEQYNTKSDSTLYYTAIHKDKFAEYLRNLDTNPQAETISTQTEVTSKDNPNSITPKPLAKPLNKPHQRIFFGAPGTGKSYQLNKEAKEDFEGEEYDKYCERVTFHSNYMYGNFVGAFKPFPKTSKDAEGNPQETITYEYIEGILVSQIVKALKNPDHNYLLIIEEINRANVSAVFGDTFQLLDRDENGDSEYSITVSRELKEFLKKELANTNLNPDIKDKLKDFTKLYLPRNLYIWATMNSADQGVMPMDTAFKRRWEFRYIGIDEAIKDSKEFNNYTFMDKKEEGSEITWNEFRIKINNKLSALHIPEDKLLGPYFISKNILENKKQDLREIIKSKVLMYLYEDAAKAHRSSLFADGCYSTYSKVCEQFDKNGLEIFRDITFKTKE